MGTQPQSDWIEWTGGECPVDPYALVDVRRSDGSEWIGYAARHLDCGRRVTPRVVK